MKTLVMMFSCKDCTERTVGCHGSCETYINERKEFDRIKAELNKTNEAGLYTSDRISKMLSIDAKKKQMLMGCKKY